MRIIRSCDPKQWENFLQSQEYSPFLQSWKMGEVYSAIGEEAVRLMVVEDGGGERGAGSGEQDESIISVCQAIVVDARRGRHLVVMYGPVIKQYSNASIQQCINELKKIAKEKKCSFIRMSPFWPLDTRDHILKKFGFRSSPLHLLAEHIWYINLKDKTENDVLMGMRKTTRNLVRRADREGVTVTVSDDPVRDLDIFFTLYEETRIRHNFVPYSEEFIRAQVLMFSEYASSTDKLHSNLSSAQHNKNCTLYIARYNGEPVAASVHMHYGGETSYHHGASTAKYPKCYASYLLQWTAIKDAIKRGDHLYNFWGIAPLARKSEIRTSKSELRNPRHPFAGVTTFKTGFGGELLDLVQCMDLPVSPKYYLTRGFELIRKWKRGF